LNPRDLHVLVVDDDADSREILALALERIVGRVDVAASAREAFEKIVADRPHVLMSDICMPGEDGCSLIRRVRALPEDAGGRIPAFAVTALATDVEIAHTRAAGFDLVVTKPVDLPALIAAVRALPDGVPQRQTPSRFTTRLARRCAEGKALVASARATAARASAALVRSIRTVSVSQRKLFDARQLLQVSRASR